MVGLDHTNKYLIETSIHYLHIIYYIIISFLANTLLKACIINAL